MSAAGVAGEDIEGAPPNLEEGVCVVTMRAREATQMATYEVLEILSQFTTVSLVTLNLAADSPIHGEFDVTQISEKGTGRTLPETMVRFVLNQVRMCLAIERSEESVVLFFGPTAYVLPVLYARLTGRTVVIEPRGDVPLTLRLRWENQTADAIARAAAGTVRGLERLSFRIANAIITYTPAMARQIGVDPDREKVHPRGARHIDLDRFGVETAYEERERVVGFVGRLEVEKRIPTLIEVAKRLAPETRFVFVGDGAYRGAVEAELAGEIERGEVEVHGWIPHEEVPEQLNRMQLLVLPSQPTEGLPTTILEAFACGTPVYATPVSGVPDVVSEGETGFLMEETDPDAVAGAIDRILDRPDLAAISDGARGLIEREYSFEATVERYREMFAAISGA